MSYSIKNFFGDVNKNWLKRHTIPNDDTSISYFDLIEKDIETDLIKIIHSELRKNTAFGCFINSFYNGRANDINMLHVFVESLTNFTNYEGLYASIGTLNLYSLRSPIIFEIIRNSKDTKKFQLAIVEPDTGLQKKEYKDKNAEIYKKYKLYLRKFGELIHFPEIETDFFAIEAEITKTYPDPQSDIDLETLYNPMTYKNLCSQFPEINFEAILNAFKIPKEIQESTTFNVQNVVYLKLINRFFKTQPLHFWKMWIKASIYTSLHELLPQEFRACFFEFYHKYLNGQQHESNLDKQAYFICRDFAQDNLGKLYIDSNYTKFKTIKDGATKIIRHIKYIAKKRILKLTWLSESSRYIACKKLEKMTLKVAYPDKWNDSFKGVNMDNEQFLLNILMLMKQENLQEIHKLCVQKEHSYWDSPCFDVNAFYYSELNEFCIPIGFLFPPFYGTELSYIQIIAGLGNIVGHEISHGFDKDGRKFDEFGNNYPWWTSLDVSLYKEKTQKIIELFNHEDYNGLKVNGELTLDENLADFGALAISLDMLHESWIGKNITKTERKKQLRDFFIWYSKTWAYKSTRAKQKTAVKTNVHAPAELRVNALLPHFDEFYEAFDFDEHYEGFVKKEDRIDVWG